MVNFQNIREFYSLYSIETRGYSIEKIRPKIENYPYMNLKKENAEPYSLISSTSEIKKTLNKFKETNEYIQQKYDFSDLNKKNEEENLFKIDQFLSVF